MELYVAALRAASGDILLKCTQTANETEERIVEAMAAHAGAMARLRYVVALRLGDDGERKLQSILDVTAGLSALDANQEKTEGDSAVVGKLRLVKVRDAWKVPVAQFIPGNGPDKAEKLLTALQRRTQAATQVREEIADNKHSTAEEALASFNRLTQAP